MTKVVCPNCGHKNRGPFLICDNCGNYMGDYNTPADTGSSASSPGTGQVGTDVSYDAGSAKTTRASPGDTITIKTGGALYRYLPIIISVAAMLVYIIAVWKFTVSSYLLIPLLLLMFGAPPLTRFLFFPIKFTRDGFTVPDNGRHVQFSYVDISNAVVRNPARGIQSVALSMDNNENPVTLDFDQMFSLRQFVTQLSRRQIPISLDRSAPLS